MPRGIAWDRVGPRGSAWNLVRAAWDRVGPRGSAWNLVRAAWDRDRTRTRRYELPPLVQLCDFGVARRVKNRADFAELKTFTGTPGFLSPQARGGRPLIRRTPYSYTHCY